MKKFHFLFFILLIGNPILAQSVITTFKIPVDIKSDNIHFDKGDSVEVFGYSYKSKIHHFAIQAKDYVHLVYVDFFPFDIDQKVLKKLPKETSAEVADLISKKKTEILTLQKQREKERALKGDIRSVIKDAFYLNRTSETKMIMNTGDTVCVVGYKAVPPTTYVFALYSKNAAGVYEIEFSKNRDKVFQDTLRYDILPPTDDPDVINTIKQQLLRIEEETKERIREEAIIKAKNDSIQAIKDKIYLDSLNKELAESKSRLLTQIKKHSPIMIIVDSWSQNSVGRISVSVHVHNCSTETIKYVTIRAYFTNAVGDKCYNEIGGGSIWQGRGVGPIGPAPSSMENFDARWGDNIAEYDFDGNSFYSRTAEYIHISSVTIQYMSGKTVTLSGNNLKSHISYK